MGMTPSLFGDEAIKLIQLVPDPLSLRAIAHKIWPPCCEEAQTTWRGRVEMFLPTAPSQVSNDSIDWQPREAVSHHVTPAFESP